MSKSKRQILREKRQKQQKKRQMITIGLIVLGAGLVAFAMIYPQFKPIGEVVVPDANPRPMAEMNTMGDPNAPVTIIEYSDYQCPYCGRFSDETEDLIIKNYVETGQVYFIYRSMGNFLSASIGRSGGPSGTESQDAAEAAYCAGDQNMYWEYHDILFANLTGEAVGAFAPRRLEAFGEALNLDMDAFNDCLDSGKYRDKVAQDGIDGTADGVTGTPAFFVNDQFISGAQPYEVFREAIEAELAK